MAPDRSLVVKLPEALHRRLRIRAAELGVPMSEIVRSLLEGWLSGVIELSVEAPKEAKRE